MHPEIKQFDTTPNIFSTYRKARHRLYPIGTTVPFAYGGRGCRHVAEMTTAKIIGHQNHYQIPAIRAVVEHSDGSRLVVLYDVERFHERVVKARK